MAAKAELHASANLLADQQDKRSIVAIEFADIEQWLAGTVEQATQLIKAPEMAQLEAGAL